MDEYCGILLHWHIFIIDCQILIADLFIEVSWVVVSDLKEVVEQLTLTSAKAYNLPLGIIVDTMEG